MNLIYTRGLAQSAAASCLRDLITLPRTAANDDAIHTPDLAEQEALAADRARNVNKAERLIERHAEFALEQQQRHLHATGELW